MSKTRHSRNEYKRALALLKERREKASLESGATQLSTFDVFCKEIWRTRAEMSRHPEGTRAEGLKQDYKGWRAIAYDRDRFGEAEVQSSRLRKERRAAIHSARLKHKKELLSLLEEKD